MEYYSQFRCTLAADLLLRSAKICRKMYFRPTGASAGTGRARRSMLIADTTPQANTFHVQSQSHEDGSHELHTAITM